MAEYKLSYTASEINSKLGKIVEETVTEADIDALFVTLGTFSVYDDEFTFEEGMIWSDFIASKYNTDDKFTYSGNYVKYYDGAGVGNILYNDKIIMISDGIINGASYYQRGTN